MAKELNLVAAPPLAGGAARIELLQGGAPLAAEDAGADVTVEDGKAFVTVDAPRTYRLANGRETETCELGALDECWGASCSEGTASIAALGGGVSCPNLVVRR